MYMIVSVWRCILFVYNLYLHPYFDGVCEQRFKALAKTPLILTLDRLSDMVQVPLNYFRAVEQ